VTGFQIIELREALNMSRAELARSLNVAPMTLMAWENDGPHNLGLEVLSGLHRAVFGPRDEGTERSARLEQIATELRLGLAAMLCFRLFDTVSKTREGGSR
jgi:transcriptional regulator with XRE-family HTH domain